GRETQAGDRCSDKPLPFRPELSSRLRTRYESQGTRKETREPPPEFRGNPLSCNHCQEFNSAAAEIDGGSDRSAGTTHSRFPINASLRVTCGKIEPAGRNGSRIGPGFGQQQPNES